MSIFGWDLPPGCGKLPGEEDDGMRECPRCRADVGPPPNEEWRAIPAIDEDGHSYVDHCVAVYKCEECGHKWESA